MYASCLGNLWPDWLSPVPSLSTRLASSAEEVFFIFTLWMKHPNVVECPQLCRGYNLLSEQKTQQQWPRRCSPLSRVPRFKKASISAKSASSPRFSVSAPIWLRRGALEFFTAATEKTRTVQKWRNDSRSERSLSRCSSVAPGRAREFGMLSEASSSFFLLLLRPRHRWEPRHGGRVG